MSAPQRVLITGAATGMGALASVSLAAAGHTVFASMRDPQGRNAGPARALTDAASGADGAVTVVELDVLSEDSAAAAVAEVMDRAGGLDVVVHNAAHLLFGVTEAFSPEEVLRAYDVNTVGALRVNRAVLPVMRAQLSGLLLWNGSGTTRAVPPFLGPYTAAKAAFDSFAESTAWDVAIYGIETTILMPGVFTQGTAHFANAGFPADTARTQAYDRVAPFLASSGADTERLFPAGTSADPQIVADEIVRLVELPAGTRPRRAVADGSDYGAEILNGAGEELRLRLARRMGITALLGPAEPPRPTEQAGPESATATLEAPVRRMIDAINAEDREGFLAAFTADAVVDDFGRRFVGLEQIAAWSDRENIGTHNRVAVTGVRTDGAGVVLDIAVRGQGYNGPGTFAITSDQGLISSMVIRG